MMEDKTADARDTLGNSRARKLQAGSKGKGSDGIDALWNGNGFQR